MSLVDSETGEIVRRSPDSAWSDRTCRPRRFGGVVTAAEVARKAADLLERDGWCQGRLYSDDGERCLLGVLIAVEQYLDTPDEVDEIDAVDEAIGCRVGTPFLAKWNDAPERTADEVIALLREVANELEAS